MQYHPLNPATDPHRPKSTYRYVMTANLRAACLHGQSACLLKSVIAKMFITKTHFKHALSTYIYVFANLISFLKIISRLQLKYIKQGI